MSAVPPRASSRTEAVLRRFHEEDKLGATYDIRMLVRLWPHVRPHAPLLVWSIGLLLAGAGFALVRPLIMRGALDSLDAPDARSRLLRTGILLAGVIVSEQLIAFPQMFMMQLVGARAMADMRRTVFRFLHTRRVAFFDTIPVGRLVTRVTNDVDAIGEMFASGALNAIGDFVRLAAIVAILLSLDWKMSLLAFAAIPPVGLLVHWTRRRIRDAFREVRAKTARMNAYVNEQVSGIAVVQAFAREAAAAAEFDAINGAYRSANNRSIVYDATLDAAIEMVSSICVAAVLWFAGVRTLGHVTFGTLFAFVAYIEMFFLPIRDLSTRYTLVQSAMAGAERVFQLLDNDQQDCPAAAPLRSHSSASVSPVRGDAPSAADAAFELSRVSFEYRAGTPVLRDVSIAAQRGEKLALVGATGAGKSTVASVLLRLYEVQVGEVRVLGRDVRSYDRTELRRLFAVVPQDVFLFPGTIATNIAAGDPLPDRRRVERALERIGALEVFLRRQEGLDAPILERGGNFSSGERQLIAFARALYRDPPLIVLDEATSSVDSDTEAHLQRALHAAIEGRTALVIAHRLSTIKTADRIIVFQKGRVVEQGSHERLLALGGVYAKLHELQFAREQLVRTS